ncbi:flavodoxin domain-containing protein [uncultured Cloacibacillus sp.]|uniref:flavodoxin family protein n=1 Tax=uncultured Cloacibacillus sp. TaxID=889794 RepID=UPI0025D23EFD|nr:flavodoxin domain-containing protein [uncultured Cloacibacillus sp.]
MKKAIVIYCSFTGNTEKVARSVAAGLERGGCAVELMTVKEAETVSFDDYDLVCFGVPSINWQPPKPAQEYLNKKFAQYKEKYGPVPPCAPSRALARPPRRPAPHPHTPPPTRPGKNALLFCTWSGPHTGMREAEPCLLVIGQYFEHFGFTVLDKWYILSEFKGSVPNSTLGRMGDIRGLPSLEDLRRVETQAENIVARLQPAQTAE